MESAHTVFIPFTINSFLLDPTVFLGILFNSTQLTMDPTPDYAGWNNASKAYRVVENVTLPLSKTLIARAETLRPLAGPDAHAFDNGCGTGVLTLALKEKFPNLPILASDASAGMVAILKARLDDASANHVIETRVLDGRDLAGVPDDSFTHTFSTFMVCLAPDPHEIAKEMYRVTSPGGVLGLAVWADPLFGYFNTPWAKACRTFVPDYEPVAIMEDSWTLVEKVSEGLEKVGFRDVDVRMESEKWRWESAEDLVGYFFDAGNPGNILMRASFEDRGVEASTVRELYGKVVREMYEVEGGAVEGEVLACIATGRK